MWLEKLSSGVLRVLTPLGPRYLNPSFMQRLYLIWVFRHFETLPVKVLNSRQSRMIETMCGNNQFVSLDLAVDYAPLLGTLEQRPPVPAMAVSRRPVSSVRDSVGPLTADAQR
jgi:hypothetical protein